MLTASVVIVSLLVVGTFIGCVLSPTKKPSDTSQPDYCEPNGRCNIGKPSQLRSDIIREIKYSDLSPEVKARLLEDLGDLP